MAFRCIASAILFAFPASSTKVTAYLRNEAPVDLKLDYAGNEIGSFTSDPPKEIPAGSEDLTFSMKGPGIYGVGLISYNVYYKPEGYSGCLCLAYLWDLAVGQCGSGFVNCPGPDFDGSRENSSSSLQSFLPCSEAPSFSRSVPWTSGAGVQGHIHIEDQNCAESNPQHYLTYVDDSRVNSSSTEISV